MIFDIDIGELDKLDLLLNAQLSTSIGDGIYIYKGAYYIGKILRNGKAITLYKELQFLFPTLDLLRNEY